MEKLYGELITVSCQAIGLIDQHKLTISQSGRLM